MLDDLLPEDERPRTLFEEDTGKLSGSLWRPFLFASVGRQA
jgi:hypothetical protein